jgi:hypothetical protein
MRIPSRIKRNWRPYSWTFYGLAVNVPCIPLKTYCEKYFFSKYQVLKMLQKKRLCAVSHKKKLYVEDREPSL